MKFTDRVSAYPNRYIMTDGNGNTSNVYLERADEPTVPGTPLNAETFNEMILDIRKSMTPIGFTFEWSPVEGGPDLSTAEKVADYYGFGTWEAYGEGRFALGVSNQYSAGSVGGEAEHTLTEEEMPRHYHAEMALVYGYDGWDEFTTNTYTVIHNREGDDYFDKNVTENVSFVYSGDTHTAGGSQPHNNMPPYVAVYRWRRIA